MDKSRLFIESVAERVTKEYNLYSNDTITNDGTFDYIKVLNFFGIDVEPMDNLKEQYDIIAYIYRTPKQSNYFCNRKIKCDRKILEQLKIENFNSHYNQLLLQLLWICIQDYLYCVGSISTSEEKDYDELNFGEIIYATNEVFEYARISLPRKVIENINTLESIEKENYNKQKKLNTKFF